MLNTPQPWFEEKRAMTKRLAVFAYGGVSYALFFLVFLYALGFIGNFYVPRSMDSAVRAPFTQALPHLQRPSCNSPAAECHFSVELKQCFRFGVVVSL
jgi:hypothetical protein